MSVQFITSCEAANLLYDGATIGVEGFLGIGVAEEIHEAVEARFENEGFPKDLTIVYAAGIGDGKDRGMNHYAKEGLVKRVIGGHWGLAPKFQPLVVENKIEAYNFPQGVISQLFRESAAKRPRLITQVGLGTFVDPENQGGKLNNITKEDLVERITIDDKVYLAYKTFNLDFAFLRGTYSDEDGNVSFDDEALSLQGMAIAMAVKNNGGKVIVQVKRKVKSGSLNPMSVKIPAVFVDYIVVVKDETKHMQTFKTDLNPDFTHSNVIKEIEEGSFPLNERKIIARRGAMLLTQEHRIVNYGIGMPESVPLVLREENVASYFIPTVEPGIFGGTPQGGQNFGCSISPQAIIDQPYMFDFYDGGGIDMAFLGLAQCDMEGNINVSKFGSKITGAGGFINITQNSRAVAFCGTFTAGGLEIGVKDGKLEILKEGSSKKFIKAVEQITFSGKVAALNEKPVYYITERAVFKLEKEGLVLIEIASGVDLEKDILQQMEFKPIVSPTLAIMDNKIFANEPMKLCIPRG